MKLLKDILYKTNIIRIHGNTNIAVANVCFDSRNVNKDSLFIAVKGTQVDGHEYIEEAIGLGALTIVAENLPSNFKDRITYVQVKNSAKSLAVIASNFFDNPSEKLKLIGVTGTNGKTTCSTLLYKLFMGLGEKSGLISTVEIKIGNKNLSTSHTTPNALKLNKVLFQMVEAGCKYCFMEVSSHGLDQKRVFNLHFHIALFTNLTHEHLDYHSTFDEYILAKKILFDILSTKSIALVNKDDKQGINMLHHTKATHYTYALKSNANFKCKIVENSFSGLHLVLAGHDFYSKLIGRFNAYNLLAVYAVASFLYKDTVQLLTALSSLESIDGRFQQIESANGIVAVVDYAHTPDALKNVLQTINEIHLAKGKVITVVGCGGERDKKKRPLMGAEAVKNSSKVIFTSDNPRSENPEKIIKEMYTGVLLSERDKVLIITNRKEAIKTAITIANPDDIVLVSGKGHEKYQEIKGKKIPFDDIVVINETFKTII